jgi:cysteine desulfuration protein SufE
VFLNERLQLLRDEFGVFDDPHERLNAVLDRRRTAPPLPEDERIETNRVRGCVSVVWLVGERHESVCRFRSDAESLLVRGLVGFLCDFFTGAPAKEIVTSDLDPLAELGLTKHLSPTRQNGLAAARAAIRAFASTQTGGDIVVPVDATLRRT